MSIYDQQLAGLQSQYSGFMNKLPSLGVSQKAIADVQQALKIQQQMQALTNQYLAAQQNQALSQRKQSNALLSSSNESSKAAQIALQNAQNASKDAKQYTPGTTPLKQAMYDADGNYIGDYTSQIKTGNEELYNQDLNKAKTFTAESQFARSSAAQARARSSQLNALATQAGQEAAQAQSKMSAFAPMFGRTQNQLTELMQKYQQMQQSQKQTPQGGPAGTTAGTGATGAAKGGAAAAQQVSGMPQQQAAAVAKANQAGQASSPFTLPNFAGLTFGGN